MPVIRIAEFFKPVNKYRNRWTEYGGVKYQSKREAAFAAELDLAFRLKQIKGWRRQVAFPLMAYGKTICRIIIDFEVWRPDGLEYVEVKGRPTESWKLKWKLFEAQYPELKKRIIK